MLREGSKRTPTRYLLGETIFELMFSQVVTPLRDRRTLTEEASSPTTTSPEDAWLLSPDDLRNKRLTPARIPKPKAATRTTPLGSASPRQSKNQLGEPRAALQDLNRSAPGWYDLQASLKKSAPPPSLTRPAHKTRAAPASGGGWRGAMAGYGVLLGPSSPSPAEVVQLTPPSQQPSRIPLPAITHTPGARHMSRGLRHELGLLTPTPAATTADTLATLELLRARAVPVEASLIDQLASPPETEAALSMALPAPTCPLLSLLSPPAILDEVESAAKAEAEVEAEVKVETESEAEAVEADLRGAAVAAEFVAPSRWSIPPALQVGRSSLGSGPPVGVPAFGGDSSDEAELQDAGEAAGMKPEEKDTSEEVLALSGGRRGSLSSPLAWRRKRTTRPRVHAPPASMLTSWLRAVVVTPHGEAHGEAHEEAYEADPEGEELAAEVQRTAGKAEAAEAAAFAEVEVEVEAAEAQVVALAVDSFREAEAEAEAAAAAEAAAEAEAEVQVQAAKAQAQAAEAQAQAQAAEVQAQAVVAQAQAEVRAQAWVQARARAQARSEAQAQAQARSQAQVEAEAVVAAWAEEARAADDAEAAMAPPVAAEEAGAGAGAHPHASPRGRRRRATWPRGPTHHHAPIVHRACTEVTSWQQWLSTATDATDIATDAAAAAAAATTAAVVAAAAAMSPLAVPGLSSERLVLGALKHSYSWKGSSRAPRTLSPHRHPNRYPYSALAHAFALAHPQPTRPHPTPPPLLLSRQLCARAPPLTRRPLDGDGRRPPPPPHQPLAPLRDPRGRSRPARRARRRGWPRALPLARGTATPRVVVRRLVEKDATVWPPETCTVGSGRVYVFVAGRGWGLRGHRVSPFV